MKSIFTSLYLILFIIVLPNSIFAQTTYTWNLAGSSSWTTSTNWTPTRSSPATNDIMIINNGGTKTISDVPSQTIGKLQLANNTTVILRPATGSNSILTVSTVASDAISIASGSSLTIAGRDAATDRTLTLTTSNTTNLQANISGTVVVGLDNIQAGAFGVFTKGGSNAIININSGGNYTHAINGGTIPTATWNINSTCLITGVTSTNPTNMGQAFGNFTWNCPAQASDANFDGIFTVNGNFTLISTGTSGIFRLAAGTTNVVGNYVQSGGINRLANTSDRTLNVSGNFSMTGGELRMSAGTAIGTMNVSGNYSHTSGTITETSTGNGTIVFNGASNQSYTGGGTISNTINFTINNSAGITLLTSVNLPAALSMTNGNIALNGNTLTLGTGSAATTKGSLIWTNGFMIGTGTITRWFDNTTAIVLGTNAGLFPFGNGTDNRNVWFGGTPSAGGTISVQHSDQSGTTNLTAFVDGGISVNRRHNMYWTLSNANGFNDSNGELRIQGSGIPGISVTADLRLIRASDAVGTSSNGTGSVANPQVNRTGLTGANFINIFYFGSNSGVNPLPVELSSFSAVVLNNGVKLKWRTETEVNNYGFEILRRVYPATGGTQNDNWEKIGFVEGSGNSNSPKEYYFVDDSVIGGKYSYRLKQIDTDGKFEYSKMIEVDLGSPAKFELSQNYPNPFNPTTTIRFSLPQSGNVNLLVYNLLGEQVAELVNGFKEAGVHSINFDAANLNSGLYIYRIETNGVVQSKKMTLIK